jgi:hypothetical protein
MKSTFGIGFELAYLINGRMRCSTQIKHSVEGEWFGMYKTKDSLLPVVVFYTTKDFKVTCHPHT